MGKSERTATFEHMAKRRQRANKAIKQRRAIRRADRRQRRIESRISAELYDDMSYDPMDY